MKREEFMKELEYLLQDVSEEEKEEALAYYRDYLEEAGPENEEKAIEDFGSPERVAAIIRAGISGDIEEGGEFTESGYEDERFRDPKYQLQRRLDLPEEKSVEKEEDVKKKTVIGKFMENMNPIMKFILILLCILIILPPLLKTGTGALSAAAGFAISMCLLFVFIGIVALCLVLGGIASFVFGIIYLFEQLFLGLLFMGAGLLMAGFGCFAMIIAFWFYGTAIPWLFRRAGDFCDRIFHQRRRQGV